MNAAPGGCLWTAQAESVPIPPAEPPVSAEVVVVGGGYTGLSAARALAGAGAAPIVLERERVGAGASARNGGFVLPGFKPDVAAIAARHGPDTARAMFTMSLEAVGLVERIVREERIDCNFERPGNLSLAARPSHVAALRQSGRDLESLCGYPTEWLDRSALQDEVGSDAYFGALLEPEAAAVQPARYLAGLAQSALGAGTRICEGVEVTAIAGSRGHFVVQTSKGTIQAREVVIATDGYTGRWAGSVGRRVIAVGSYIVATAVLEPALRQRLIPRGRVMSDTRRLLNYFRLSPDGRMVFGGRAGFLPGRLDGSRTILIEQMRRVFPVLADVPIEYAWGGHLGFTWDQLPHIGLRDGMHYALGYCGHGVALSTWLGHAVGQALAGKGELPPIPETGFRPMPGSTMADWLLPLVGLYYRLRDALD